MSRDLSLQPPGDNISLVNVIVIFSSEVFKLGLTEIQMKANPNTSYLLNVAFAFLEMLTYVESNP